MDKKNILNQLLNAKTKDYTYAIGFFLIFSFFLFFVIRPNLLAVFSSNKKIEELTKTDTFYEQQIDKIIAIQSTFEQNRDDFNLLEQAISSQPQVSKILSDLKDLAGKNNLQVEKITINDVNLRDKTVGQKVRSITVSIELSGGFEDMTAFIKGLHDQRRLKFVRKLDIGKNQVEASESATLKMISEIEAYYL